MKLPELKNNKVLKYTLTALISIPIALACVGIAYSALDPLGDLNALESKFSGLKTSTLKSIEELCQTEQKIAIAKLELPAKGFTVDQITNLKAKAEGKNLVCRTFFQ